MHKRKKSSKHLFQTSSTKTSIDSQIKRR